MSLKASISGIRGIVGDSLTPSVIIDYLYAYTRVVGNGNILIGRDSRVSGDTIVELVKSVLKFLGRNVSDIGIVPTPTVLFGVSKYKYAGGIVITASHNPSEWNALKLVNSSGKFLSPEEFKELNKHLGEPKIYADHSHIGVELEPEDVEKAHIDKIKDFINIDAISSSKIKVVLDGVHGGAGVTAYKFLQSLNCIIKGIFIEPTGIFPHPPEPTPENLAVLSDEVKKFNADIGFAVDPDGDRLVIADSDGVVLSEELTLAIALDRYLSGYQKSEVVVNLSTSRLS